MSKSEVKRVTATKFPHYHMCGTCAIKMGADDNTGVCTVIKGVCQYCKNPIEQFLIPWVDFDWPKEPNVNRIAKATRD
jgi:hypothetical protein